MTMNSDELNGSIRQQLLFDLFMTYIERDIDDIMISYNARVLTHYIAGAPDASFKIWKMSERYGGGLLINSSGHIFGVVFNDSDGKIKTSMDTEREAECTNYQLAEQLADLSDIQSDFLSHEDDVEIREFGAYTNLTTKVLLYHLRMS